jgi:Dolichyl-phosphate-mannose-protein mannosyltransferase
VLANTPESAVIAPPSGQALPATPRPLAAAHSIRVPVGAWLFGIVLLSMAVRIVLASFIPVPWLIPDELVYSGLARSFAATGEFLFRGEPFSPWAFGPLYPMAIAPAFRLAPSMVDAYFAVRVLNCALMSSAAVPAYLLARRVLDRRTALIAATFAVFIPAGVYTARVGVESMAYPAFLWAALAVVSLLERPHWKRELLALGAILAAASTRAQLVVLFPALVLSVLLLAVAGEGERDRTLKAIRARLAAFPLMFATVGALAVAMAVFMSLGVPVSELVGSRDEVTAGASALAVLKSFVLHMGVLDLYVGILPFAALAILFGKSFGADVRPELRAFCIFTTSASVLSAAVAARYLVGVYEGPYAHEPGFLRVYDRYVFYVVPLLVIAFLAWTRMGLPRPRVALVAGIAAGLVPVSFIWGGDAWKEPTSLAFLPWDILRQSAGSTAVYVLLVPASAYLGYVLVRSRNVKWMVFLVAANFVLVGRYAQAVAYGDSGGILRAGSGAAEDRSWVDRAVGRDGDVVAIWSGVARRGKAGWRPIWQSELLNNSVRRIYYLREPLPFELPGVQLRSRGGRLYSADGQLGADYVLTDVRTPVAGVAVATNRRVGMILYRVDGPVRLR